MTTEKRIDVVFCCKVPGTDLKEIRVSVDHTEKPDNIVVIVTPGFLPLCKRYSIEKAEMEKWTYLVSTEKGSCKKLKYSEIGDKAKGDFKFDFEVCYRNALLCLKPGKNNRIMWADFFKPDSFENQFGKIDHLAYNKCRVDQVVVGVRIKGEARKMDKFPTRYIRSYFGVDELTGYFIRGISKRGIFAHTVTHARRFSIWQLVTKLEKINILGETIDVKTEGKLKDVHDSIDLWMQKYQMRVDIIEELPESSREAVAAHINAKLLLKILKREMKPIRSMELYRIFRTEFNVFPEAKTDELYFPLDKSLTTFETQPEIWEPGKKHFYSFFQSLQDYPIIGLGIKVNNKIIKWFSDHMTDTSIQLQHKWKNTPCKDVAGKKINFCLPLLTSGDLLIKTLQSNHFKVYVGIVTTEDTLIYLVKDEDYWNKIFKLYSNLYQIALLSLLKESTTAKYQVMARIIATFQFLMKSKLFSKVDTEIPDLDGLKFHKSGFKYSVHCACEDCLLKKNLMIMFGGAEEEDDQFDYCNFYNKVKNNLVDYVGRDIDDSVKRLRELSGVMRKFCTDIKKLE